MLITRDDVLTAIDKEPLTVRSWVEAFSEPSTGQCSVCAVGAVLRNQGLSDMDIPEVAVKVTRGIFNCEDGSVPRLLKDGLYLSALSVQWERMVDAVKPSEWFMFKANDLEKLKPKLRAWVLKHLPDGPIYIGDATPNDMELVPS